MIITALMVGIIEDGCNSSLAIMSELANKPLWTTPIYNNLITDGKLALVMALNMARLA